MEAKQILEKEKYMDLFLEADPEKEVVEKYLKDSDVLDIFILLKCGLFIFYDIMQ